MATAILGINLDIDVKCSQAFTGIFSIGSHIEINAAINSLET